ncbi:MAG: hypothetical protein K6T66_09345 [Peptococcaceae bacterium]|nr:hypothetical protein [Peptococcaceae bacterium]
MIRKVLVTLSLVILLAAAGCGKGSSDRKAAGDNDREKKPGVEATENQRTKENPKPTSKIAPGDTPELVIKTDNPVSNQEAGAMLDELDKQLTELMDTLDRLDDLDDTELEY